MTEKLNVFAVSDSAGDTALSIAQAALIQFPNLKVNYIKIPFVATKEKITEVVDQANEDKGIIIFSLVGKGLAEYMNEYAKTKNVTSFDCMSPIINFVKQKTGIDPSGKVGATHQMNDTYFDRISAVEFAVLYDDGKDPSGFLKADLVLVGVSRTSKTPLSLFLANHNLKVANYPLMKGATLPKELFEIDSKKIVGLTTDPEVLLDIRRERLISYGLDPDAAYSDLGEIKDELKSADELFKKLNCMVVNTAHRSIEETAALIMQHLNLDDDGNPAN